MLLVEDGPDSRDLVTTVLAASGAEVAAAADVEEALRLLQTRDFDAIVSDIGLPERDGYAFRETVRASPIFAKIPAAALTAYARAEDRQRAFAVGYQMHVPKPVDPAELVAIVANLARIAAAMRS